MTERQRGGRAVKAEARREAILDATMAEIAERGYRGTTLAAVAERVGLTQPGLLHHFPSKEHLLIGVLDARDRWDAAALLANSTDVRLSHLEQIVEFNADRPGVVQTFTALAAESATGQHPAREFFTERYASVREGMAELLRAELGDRLAGGLTPEQAAPLLIAVIDGIQIQWLLAPDEVDMPAAFRNFLALLTAMTPSEHPTA
ncbi:TetR/AcrR family transcriptional regulator [Rhodococcus sp. MS16]|uniref:TetR family transcriptional regulator n=1 Tax=Nocardia globerula TaxID=1818 RepID=A0A652YLS8_NOCGL|nr:MULTISPECIES: TetR/AcrR family transcriptional regulator [Rhodococcus]NMD60007.1 TetR/AcrR family transcriptional regulator [Nocardia globerula]MDV8069061.1 TetR/AcrR family transcriptional regulator [Rhodococcus sp. IEGM 1366]NRI67092.1 TetR/AcrR family transcriptional regulator [Rhodococcus sp. MS16]PVX63884.1 TetR family transcriptional regulator [Rhodococcus globerulus]RZL26338.1 MAG: TetR/AcrR family transcriptional regulator [Rhodococcus sp. (in: high G+C Gram-positive bacteria)]